MGQLQVAFVPSFTSATRSPAASLGGFSAARRTSRACWRRCARAHGRRTAAAARATELDLEPVVHHGNLIDGQPALLQRAQPPARSTSQARCRRLSGTAETRHRGLPGQLSTVCYNRDKASRPAWSAVHCVLLVTVLLRAWFVFLSCVFVAAVL